MDRPFRPFERFVVRLHRRFVLVRALEQAGLGLLCGCAAALPLTGVLLWRGEPAMALATTAMGIGAAAGLLSGCVRRPTPMDAAAEADRQLDLADLLSSAWSVRGRDSDPWAGAVLATADGRAGSLSPATVIVNRFGGRAWGGIGLAAALVFALALVPTAATESRAGSTSRNASPTALLPAKLFQQPTGSNANSTRRFPPQADPQEESADRRGAPDEDSADAKGPAGADDAAHRPSASADPTGRGTGASQSKPPPRDDHPPMTGTPKSDHRATGEASAGTGNETSNPEGSSAAPSGTSAGPGPSRQAPPPWRSDQWPAAARGALRQAHEGRVPDRYHDVLRGYFDPDRK